MLTIIREVSGAQTIVDKREALRKLKQATNILIDVYAVGILILYMISGGYEWASTLEIQAVFDARMKRAESIFDVQTLKAIQSTLKKCLLLH